MKLGMQTLLWLELQKTQHRCIDRDTTATRKGWESARDQEKAWENGIDTIGGQVWEIARDTIGGGLGRDTR